MKNIYVKTIACLVFLLGAKAQAQTVSGLVTSDDGPLPGATIVIKGTNNGATADFDGNFSINASEDDILVVSFVGFASQEVAVNGQDQITVFLQTDNELEEVVVTGYGSQRSKEITSAVVRVNEEEFNRGTINSANQLLQGKVAGLSIYNRGGNPNSDGVVRLRGISTVGANVQPLVVIDGIIGASLDNVDPADIASINVLKDGSAAAIYGSRGSAGVILVTTKRGSSGKARAAGDWSLALPDVNIIRGRAGAAPLSSIDADEFLAERGREMFQESTRRSDQIRFGKYYAGEDDGKGTTVTPAYKNVMPIPLDAINAANGSLSQNEGY